MFSLRWTGCCISLPGFSSAAILDKRFAIIVELDEINGKLIRLARLYGFLSTLKFVLAVRFLLSGSTYEL